MAQVEGLEPPSHGRTLRERPKGKSWGRQEQDTEQELLWQQDIQRAMRRSLREGAVRTPEPNRTSATRRPKAYSWHPGVAVDVLHELEADVDWVAGFRIDSYGHVEGSVPEFTPAARRLYGMSDNSVTRAVPSKRKPKKMYSKKLVDISTGRKKDITFREFVSHPDSLLVPITNTPPQDKNEPEIAHIFAGMKPNLLHQQTNSQRLHQPRKHQAPRLSLSAPTPIGSTLGEHVDRKRKRNDDTTTSLETNLKNYLSRHTIVNPPIQDTPTTVNQPNKQSRKCSRGVTVELPAVKRKTQPYTTAYDETFSNRPGRIPLHHQGNVATSSKLGAHNEMLTQKLNGLGVPLEFQYQVSPLVCSSEELEKKVDQSTQIDVRPPHSFNPLSNARIPVQALVAHGISNSRCLRRGVSPLVVYFEDKCKQIVAMS